MLILLIVGFVTFAIMSNLWINLISEFITIWKDRRFRQVLDQYIEEQNQTRVNEQIREQVARQMAPNWGAIIHDHFENLRQQKDYQSCHDWMKEGF